MLENDCDSIKEIDIDTIKNDPSFRKQSNFEFSRIVM